MKFITGRPDGKGDWTIGYWPPEGKQKDYRLAHSFDFPIDA